MKRGKWKRRLLTALLSVAMVCGNINATAFVSYAEGEVTEVAPAAPNGLEAKVWTNADANEGKIWVCWNTVYDAGTPTSWTIYIDDVEVDTVNAVAAYFFENTYDVGEHTVKLVAHNEAGDSAPATYTFTIEEEDPNAEVVAPTAPLGVDARVWDTADANEGKIWVTWNGVFNGGTPTSWIVSIDGEVVGTETAVAAYFYENTYAAGDHTVSVVAVNEAGQSEATTVTFTIAAGSNEEEDELGDDNGVNAEAIILEDLGTVLYRSEDEGSWSGDSNVVMTLDGTTATFTADSFGPNAGTWGVQWQNIQVTSEAAKNILAFDVVSTINKSINVKNDTTGVMETFTLVAGESQTIKMAGGAAATFVMDLSGNGGPGTITISNMKYYEGVIQTTTGGGGDEGGENVSATPIAITDALVIDDVIGTYYAGGWGGDSDVVFTPNGKELIVTAGNFGWDLWAIQLQGIEMTSTAENNVFEFDVVSTIDKSILVKNEGTQAQTTIELTANVPYHYAERVTGTTGNYTFALTGGSASGQLTFSNWKFGPEATLYNFEEAIDAESFQFYVGNEEWAGWANATGTSAATAYTMDVTSFGSAEWGLQMILKDLIAVEEGKTYKVGATLVSDVDKNVTIKVGEDGNETRELALERVALTADEPKTITFMSDEADGDFDATLYFAAGKYGEETATEGSITVSSVWIAEYVSNELKAAPAIASAIASDKANGYTVGDAVTVTFATGLTEWTEGITAVKVNNQTVAAENYTVEDGQLVLASDVFTKQGVYKITVEATGYETSAVTIPVYATDVADENWTTVWADEFNGTELDTTKWSYELGIQSGEDGAPGNGAPTYWGNNEKQYYTREAIEVEDGYLVITGDALTQDVKDQYGVTDTTVQYTSGRIRTVTDDGEILKATTYGRIEASMSLPASQGYWPAFWMLPTQETVDYYGGWAASGEIDIMEAIGQTPNMVNGTIHYGGAWPANVYTGGTYYFPDGTTTADEHVYAIEWEPGEIRWYVDDVLYHIENDWYAVDSNGVEYTYPAPFDEDFYILLNLAMSGNYVGNVMPDEMGLQMKVNYVRVLTDETQDYDDSNVTPPVADRDVESFESYGGYVDLIVDKDYATLLANAYGDGGNVTPGTGLWWSAVNTGANAASTVAVTTDGAAKFDVTAKGANDYNVQLIQNIPIAKGYTYRVTFDAWTDVTGGRSIRVAPGGDNAHNWKSYDSGITPTITSEQKTYTFDFTMKEDSDPAVRLEFNLGGALGTVYIDNVSVIALTDEQLAEDSESGPKEPLANGEHIYNGTFDKGTGMLGYWDTVGTQGSTADRNYAVTVGTETTQLVQTGIQVLSNDEYVLTFDAKTTGTGKIHVELTDGEELGYVATEFDLTADMDSYELPFTAPDGATTDMGTLTITFIGEGETITLDNVSMIRTTNVNMDWDNYEFYPLGDDPMDDWSVYQRVDGESTTDIVLTNIGNGEMAFEVAASPSTENWHVLLQKLNVAVSNGQKYRIKYAIKSSVADQTVQVKLEDTTYSPCYLADLTLGTDWTYVDTTFTSSLAGAGDLKFCLASVSEACNVYVKDVHIELDGIPFPQFKEGKEVSSMKVGEQVKLEFQHDKKVQEKYNSFTFYTEDTDIITLDTEGNVIAKAAGTATIVVTSTLGTTYTVELTIEGDGSGDEDDQLTAFVKRMYTVALGRDAEESGVAHWVGLLQSGQNDGEDIAVGFFTGDEFIGRNLSDEEYLEVLYATFFDREADAEGWAYNMSLLQNGVSRDDVLAVFINSTEFDALCTSYGIEAVYTQEELVTSFVERMYTVALNRTAEEDGVAHWVGLLLGGDSDGEDIAVGFFTGNEFVGRNLSDEEYLETLYATFFDREADAEGWAYNMSLLQNGVSREDVLAGFINSTEFDALCTGYGIEAVYTQEELVRKFVDRMYTSALGRASEEEGAAYWTAQLLAGNITGAKLADDFISGQEFTNRGLNDREYVEVLYATFFNREGAEADIEYWMSVAANNRRAVLVGFSSSTEFKELCEKFGITAGTIE